MTPTSYWAPLEPGAALRDGRFRVLGETADGEGGMARVYVAEDRDTPGEQVAVKEMRISSGMSYEEQRRLFRNEAELLARLRHANVPSFVDAFEEHQRAFIAMEYIRGMTLYRHLHQARRGGSPNGLSPDNVLKWTLVLCDVLGYLHRQHPKVIYRDLDPTNVMVDRHGNLKLIDYGIARTFKPGSAKDTIIMGKTGYVAPEIYDHQTDERSDIYSLGATMFYLLTGQQPPDCTARKGLPALHEVHQRVPQPIGRIVDRAMDLEPDRRYRTARDMAGVVEEALEVVHGAEKRRLCPACKARSGPTARFCGSCGARLDREPIARLQVRGRPDAVPVTREGVLVGRSCPHQGIYPELDLGALDPDYVSRHHARVEMSAQGFTICDLGSSNGTTLNGQRLSVDIPYPVRGGDVIGVGALEIEFEVA